LVNQSKHPKLPTVTEKTDSFQSRHSNKSQNEKSYIKNAYVQRLVKNQHKKCKNDNRLDDFLMNKHGSFNSYI